MLQEKINSNFGYHLLLLGEKDPKLTFVAENKLGSAVNLSGKCKRLPRHLLFLLWFSWGFKIAEVNGNRAKQGSIYFYKHLHDKPLCHGMRLHFPTRH